MTSITESRDAPSVERSGVLLPIPFEGVRLERLKVLGDHRGQLVPVYDPAHPFWDEPIVWGYNWTLRPGRIKGWGMHKRQADRYYILSADMRTVLYDLRDGSPTYGRFHVIDFTRSTPGVLRIPPGVWHANQNWGDADAICMNFPTVAYDPADPDKYRIDPHSGEIPFDFRLRDY